ncbi:MAG: hypothetical protein E5Y88_24530 [Mesorhizobium sp.]|uniref:hypothetical protein n=1 Tax=unclassified Mesorhizobium TaxID=325217 RepID=UPI000FD4D841|nr:MULTISPECIES: hypothetical protein [unclassified Mesorhizobium]RUV02405.1 hypothetical protein EOB36_09760 [Mesorhizobium sp. M6A.T.Cr.TU.017.01.1.1]RWN31777.1 MAG: hypothetical protein EOR95_18520 [Mesorhizobium sp.]RWQ31017.1 MAG: hypothetical protein EOS20_30750 [Mesorhizobium sp.]TIL23087.1 MAG: hypothetical protein E5Y88_24530 [Mesorhizobium sp.]
MRKLFAIAAMIVFVVQGCASTSFKDLKPISQTDIYKVIAEVKRQLGVYTAYQRSPLGYPSVIANSRTKVCGNGLLGFDIVSVKMELLSTSEGTVSAGVAVSPVPVGGGAVGGSVGASQVTTDSQVLLIQEEVSLSSKALDYQPGALENAPIAKAMVNLWSAALQSGGDASDICLKLKQGSTDANTFKMSINVVKGINGKVSVGLAPVTLTGGGEFKGTTGNTITVKFEPHDFRQPPPPRPRPCLPRDTRPECQKHFIPA